MSGHPVGSAPYSRRAYVFPNPGESVTMIAHRLFPRDEGAPMRLLSWNLHLVTRRSLSYEPGANGDPGPLLGTDIVYIESPLPLPG